MSGVGSKGIPLSKEEVMILLHLIESNPAATNKLTNSATNRLKEEAWKTITEAFNSMIKSSPRKPNQLKLKWENLKKTARKIIKLRLSGNRVGSSERVYIPHFKAIKKIADILGIALNCNGNDDTIVFDDEGSHSLPSSNGLDSSPFGDSEDSSLPSGDIGYSCLSSVKNGESSISSVKNGDSSSTAGKNLNVCVSCGESRNARKPSKHEDGTITFAENGANSMEFDENKNSATQPIKSGVVSLNKSDGNIESVPSIITGNDALAPDKNDKNPVLHGKDWAVSILPVESGDISIHPMKTGDNSITSNSTMPSIKSVDVSIPPVKSGVVSILPMNTGDNSITLNNTMPSIKSVDVSIPPVKSGVVSILPMNTGDNSITLNNTMPSIKSVDVSIPSTKSGKVSMPPMNTEDNSTTPNKTIPSIKSADIFIPPVKDSIAPIQSRDVSIPIINSEVVFVSHRKNRDISGLCGKCGDNIAKSVEPETHLEDGNVSLLCEDMDAQNEDVRDESSPVVKSWGDLMPCEDIGDVTEQFEEDDNVSSGDESVIAEDRKPDVHEIRKNNSGSPTYGYHDAMTDYYRAKTRKVRLETMVLKAKLRLEVEKFKFKKRKLELELLQLKKK